MSDTPSDLEDLRRRIDGIDDRLQDLLIERMEIVVAGRGVQAQRRRRRGAPTGARGGDPAPAGGAQPRRAAAGDTGADLARAARRDDPRAGQLHDRGLRPAGRAGLLGHGARPLRQPYADAGLPLDRPGDPRRHRGPGRDRRTADAAGGGPRPVVAASAVDRRQRAACDRPTAVRRARQRPLRRRRRARDRPRRGAADRPGPDAAGRPKTRPTSAAAACSRHLPASVSPARSWRRASMPRGPTR